MWRTCYIRLPPLNTQMTTETKLSRPVGQIRHELGALQPYFKTDNSGYASHVETIHTLLDNLLSDN